MKKEIEERMANRRRQDEHCFLALTHQDGDEERRGRTSDAWAESSIAGALLVVVGVGGHHFENIFDASPIRLLQRSCQ